MKKKDFKHKKRLLELLINMILKNESISTTIPCLYTALDLLHNVSIFALSNLIFSLSFKINKAIESNVEKEKIIKLSEQKELVELIKEYRINKLYLNELTINDLL